jgi:dolichol-phosphate mannosyltransferase
MSSRVLTDCLRELTSLAGENLSMLRRVCFGILGVLAMSVDLAFYLLLVSNHSTPATAHVLSFFAATAFFYLLILRRTLEKSQQRASIQSTWRRHGSFLAVALTAMFLRGGVLATFTELLGVQSAILPAIAVSAIINYLGCAFFVFPLAEKGSHRDLRWKVLALAVIGYTFLLRLSYLGATDLLPQEAYYWNYAQHLSNGYLDHPPMVAWVIWLGTVLLGDTEMGVRLGAFVAWIVTAFFCFRLTRDLFDPSTALRALLLLAILPFFFSTGMVMTPDAPIVACWAGLLYFLERSLIGGSHSAWWGAGVCAGLGMLSKYTIALLAPAILLFLLIDRQSRRWFLKPELYAALVLAILFFAPVIIWNAEHQWASFVFQGSRRFSDSLSFTFPELVGSVLLLLTPTGALAALVALYPKTEAKQEGIDIPPGRRKRLFVSLFTLFPLLFFVAFSLVRTAKLNWTGPLWLGLIPLMAWQMVPHETRRPGRLFKFLQRAWTPTLLLFILLFGLLLHFWALGLPGVSYPKGADVSLLFGWRDLARKIDRIDKEIQISKGIKPLVVGMDKCYITSELIFYRNKQGGGKEKKELLSYTTGRHLFGMDSLMYRYWFPESRINQFRNENSILILVTRELHELNNDLISSSGWKMDKLQDLGLKRDGMAVGHYYYVLARPK